MSDVSGQSWQDTDIEETPNIDERSRSADEKVPWPANKMSEGLMDQLARALQSELESQLETFIAPQNMLRFRHGNRWSIRRVDDSEDSDRFQRLQTLLSMDKNDLLHNDLSKLADAMLTQANALAQQSVNLLQTKIEEAVEASGNKVSFDEAGSFAEGYLEMLRKSKFSADKEGEATPPNLYARPELGAEIEQRFVKQSPAFKLRVEEIMHVKAAEAIDEERVRLSRYEGFDEGDE